MTLVKRIAAAVFAIGFASLPLAAQNDAREMQDRIQIEELMWRYVRALDSGNAEAYAATYTPDGQFGTGANATKGAEALKKLVTTPEQRAAADKAKGVTRAPMYHMSTDHSITFIDKDHVRYEAYYLTVTAAAGTAMPARVAAAGREVDEIVRVNGKWLIKVRDVSPKD
jgi:hypothetical protein